MFSPPKISWVVSEIKYICLHLLPVFYLIQPSIICFDFRKQNSVLPIVFYVPWVERERKEFSVESITYLSSQVSSFSFPFFWRLENVEKDLHLVLLFCFEIDNSWFEIITEASRTHFSAQYSNLFTVLYLGYEMYLKDKVRNLFMASPKLVQGKTNLDPKHVKIWFKARVSN